MFRKVYRPGGEFSNRTTEEQKNFRSNLEKELNAYFSEVLNYKSPFCCVTLNGLYACTLGNNQIYVNAVTEVLRRNFTSFDLRKFWGCTTVQAHHIIPVRSRNDLNVRKVYTLNELKNGVLINSYLHKLLHQKEEKEEDVGEQLINLATSIYSAISASKNAIELPYEFYDLWASLLATKGLISRSKINEVSNRR